MDLASPESWTGFATILAALAANWIRLEVVARSARLEATNAKATASAAQIQIEAMNQKNAIHFEAMNEKHTAFREAVATKYLDKDTVRDIFRDLETRVSADMENLSRSIIGLTARIDQLLRRDNDHS